MSRAPYRVMVDESVSLIGLNYERPLHGFIDEAIAGGMLTAVEIIPDHYAPHRVTQLRDMLRGFGVPYSLHFISNSPGSGDFDRRNDLAAFGRLMADVDPVAYSDHLTCCRAGAVDLRQNLPVPRTSEMVELFVENIRLLKRRLGGRRRIPFLIENVSTSFEYEASTIPPVEFYRSIAERSDSYFLLDVHNIYVDEINHGADAMAFVESLPPARIKEIHVAGGSWTASRRTYCDSHDAKTPSRVLELLDAVLSRACPDLIVLERQSSDGELVMQSREILADLAEIHRIDTSWTKRRGTGSQPSSLSA